MLLFQFAVLVYQRVDLKNINDPKKLGLVQNLLGVSQTCPVIHWDPKGEQQNVGFHHPQIISLMKKKKNKLTLR